MPRALFDNQLAFLRSHRGDVDEVAGATLVTGETPGLPLWIPCEDASDLPDGCTAVRLMPWSGASWPQRLAAAGFAPAEELSHMESMTTVPVSMHRAEGINVTEVIDERGADVFASVQSAGFLGGSDPTDSWWQECFRTMARRNVGRGDQTFYVAYWGCEAAAVTLVIRAGGVAGIYAVATRPEYRRRGLSWALVARAVSDSREAGFDRVTLQASPGSSAEDLYGRMGFVNRFRSVTWRSGTTK